MIYPELRGLTLTQPWATLVAKLQKGWETRSWSTRYRGLIAIHAAKGFPRRAQQMSQEEPCLTATNCPPEDFPRGSILCIVQIINCVPTEGVRVTPNEVAFGDFGPGRYAWQLKHLSSLQYPIPCKGMLGLWTIPSEVREALNPVLAAAVLAQQEAGT